MNPWAFVVIGLGILIVIVGVQGSQHTFAHAITGHSGTGTKTTSTSKTGAGGQLA